MKDHTTHRSIGNQGETAVCRYLRRRSYRILARNYTVKGGEIDIIAERFSHIVFVEVKTRKADTDFSKYPSAAAAVTAEKQTHLRYAAARFLHDNPTKKKPRFDVAEVYYRERGKKTPIYTIIYRKEAF